MKTAIWILSIVVVLLLVVVYLQYKTIQKLTPVNSTPGTTGHRTADETDTTDALASFGNQIDATKQAIKDLQIKATFQP